MSGILSANTTAAARGRRAGSCAPLSLAAEDRVAPAHGLSGLDWERVARELDGSGTAVLERQLSAVECQQLRRTYAERPRFRSRVVMRQHGFGSGEYQYFDYPLPQLVAELRRELYLRLAPLANRWQEELGQGLGYPPGHGQFLARCRAAGQHLATPLLLKYGSGDYNCLHQDVYGACVFPLQVALLLSRPGEDFGGGEFVVTEQRPRRQSRAEVVPLRQGDAVVFAVRERPARAARGIYRVSLRHGVSRVRWGERYTLGVIFHDAR